MYTGGGGFAEGNYALEFDVLMYQPVSQAGMNMGPEKLAVRVTCHALPFSDGEQPRLQYYSLGSKAHLSFAPNPETGKGLVAVPGGPATSLNDSTNWAVFLKSLHDAGMPEGTFSNDISVLDGIHVHMQNQPEPESRKSMRNSKTGEAAEEIKNSGFIAVVSEILPGGAPWEDGGGLPGSEPVKTAPAKAAPKAAAKAAPKAAVVTAPAGDEDDIETAALAGVSAMLEANPKGMKKLPLRGGVFKHLNAQYGNDITQAVIATYFTTDEKLNELLGPVGFVVKGTDVVPA
jgi:hypothetical protein